MTLYLQDIADVLRKNDDLDETHYSIVSKVDVREAAKGGRLLAFMKSTTHPVDTYLRSSRVSVAFKVYGDQHVSDVHAIGDRMYGPAEIYEEGTTWGEIAKNLSENKGIDFILDKHSGTFKGRKVESSRDLEIAVIGIVQAQQLLSSYIAGDLPLPDDF